MIPAISRRKFLALSAAATSTALVRGATGLSGTAPERRKILHLIGHAHIDAAWQWPWRDAADTVLTTWQSAVDRMRETPGFCFSASSAQFYRWVREADPRLSAEIDRRIREGRWEVIGGWVVEPDCNLPSTESFFRQALLGKRYLRQAWNADVTVGFNPDSFGHAWGLPSILATTGYRYYAFERPAEDNVPVPYPRLFWWEGPDGARILTWRIAKSYAAQPASARTEPERFFPPGFSHGALVFGVGNHGGGPTRAQLALIEQMKADPTLPVELRYSTWREFFSAVERDPAMRDLPVVRTDLQHVFRGCYSAAGEVKWLNRRAERQLMTAETLSSVARLALGSDYPAATYGQAWWKVCFNQFHDVLAGSGMRSIYVDARDDYGAAASLATASTVAAVEGLSRRVDLSAIKEGALFCFNPLPWPRVATLEVQLDQNGPTASLQAPDGSLLPLQRRENISVPRYAARVALPACGYRAFALSRTRPRLEAPPRPAITPGPRGGIDGFSGPGGIPLLASPIGFVVVEDKSNAWGMGAPPAFDHELGRPTWISSQLSGEAPADARFPKLSGEGPVGRTWTQKATWRSSTITVELTEIFGDPVLGISISTVWNEAQQILMLEVPTVFRADQHLAKVAGATIVRRNTGEEEPGQDWVALEGEIGGATCTVALFNAQTYSYNCKGGRFRTVIVRSAPWVRDYEHGPNQDNGLSVRRFGLMAAQGSALSLGLERRALEFQVPVECVVDSVHAGTEPWEQSFLEVHPDNVSVTAIKRAEAGEELVLRLQETRGIATQATVRSRSANWSGTVPLGSWSMVTVAVTDPGSPRAVLRTIDPLERALTAPAGTAPASLRPIPG